MIKKTNLKMLLVMVVFLVVLVGTARADVIVDDFDSYGPDPALRNVWKDVWSGIIPKNHAEVFVETDPALVIDGNSMRFYYRNFEMSGPNPVGCTAEASTTDLEVGTDWTAGGVNRLVLHFYGDPANGQEPHANYTIANDRMWISLLDGDSNEGFVRYPDMNAVMEASWHEWDIDLADPCFSDVNLANVAKMYIGFGGVKGGAVSKYGAGYTMSGDTVWFDDIRLISLLIYVDANTPDNNDGSSWAKAYKYLQDALADASVSGDDIWVAEGTYKPDVNSANPGGTNDWYATFQLINGVALYGGFPSGGGSRDPDSYETILSGDIGTPDVNTDNSYHVVTGSGTEPNAILDGFTITAGFANGSDPDDDGGGMYNDNGSPTLRKCTFSENFANIWGGGMYNDASSSPTVTNCTFSDNSADYGGAGMFNYDQSSPIVTDCNFSGNSASTQGGGMYNEANSSPTLSNCTFTGNWAVYGGGMYNDASSNPKVTNCTFSDNSADYGGGMYNYDNSSPIVTDCTFSGNSAVTWNGGGMYNEDSNAVVIGCTFSGNSAVDGGGMCNSNSDPAVTNCIFSGNSASYGGGIHDFQLSSPTLTGCTFSGNLAGAEGGGMYNTKAPSSAVTNCILWGNTDSGPTDESAQIDGDTPVVNYSCIQGLTGALGGTGNIGGDPLFKDADGDDNIVGTEDDNLHVSSFSPCIDAGDNNAVPADTADLDEDGNTSERTPLDLAGNDRFTDDPVIDDTGNPAAGYPEIVEMGAYERYEFCGDAGYPFPAMDFNHDCLVNFVDFAMFLEHWLEDAGPE